MNTHINARCAQAGSFLLEALIGILIFSFGILGIVGLQAQSLRHTGESEYRAEAVYLANSLVSQMWADNPPVPIAAATYLHDKYDSTAGGAGYVAFKNTVGGASGVAGLPGVIPASSVNLPVVLVDSATDCKGNNAPVAPSTQSHVVIVCVYWQVPGDTDIHNYTMTGVVGANAS